VAGGVKEADSKRREQWATAREFAISYDQVEPSSPGMSLKTSGDQPRRQQPHANTESHQQRYLQQPNKWWVKVQVIYRVSSIVRKLNICDKMAGKK
jgi:hypothetical protein